MGARASTSIISLPIPVSGGPVFEIRTGPTDYAVVHEIYIKPLSVAASATYSLGVGRPAAIGSGINTSYALNADGWTGDTGGGVVIATDWDFAPTIPANFLRRASSLANTIGFPFVFKFRGGIKMNPSSSVVIWMITNSLAAFAGFELDGLEMS